MTNINLIKTSFDQIFIGIELGLMIPSMLVAVDCEAEAITLPIETVTKLKGKLPMTRVEKNIPIGKCRTPQIKFSTLYGSKGKNLARSK